MKLVAQPLLIKLVVSKLFFYRGFFFSYDFCFAGKGSATYGTVSAEDAKKKKKSRRKKATAEKDPGPGPY